MKPVFKKISRTNKNQLIGYDVNKNIYLLNSDNRWDKLTVSKIYEIILKSKINLHSI
jgi:hypothetical protein